MVSTVMFFASVRKRTPSKFCLFIIGLWLLFCFIFKLYLNEKLKKRDSGFSINPSERPPVTISSIWCHLCESSQARPEKSSKNPHSQCKYT